jgi:hypothetical protein
VDVHVDHLEAQIAEYSDKDSEATSKQRSPYPTQTILKAKRVKEQLEEFPGETSQALAVKIDSKHLTVTDTDN